MDEGRHTIKDLEEKIVDHHQRYPNETEVYGRLTNLLNWLRVEYDSPSPWSSLEDLWERNGRRSFVAENKNGAIFTVAAKTPSGHYNFIGWNASGIQQTYEGKEEAWKVRNERVAF